MTKQIIAIDQSTQSSKVMLFDEKCKLLDRVNLSHHQYYPKAGWVEHNAEEIYLNVLTGAKMLLGRNETKNISFSLAITNQRETVVVWNRITGKPVCNAVVWQCLRGIDYCEQLKAQGYAEMVQEKSGLLIDPYFSASGVKWILDNVSGARQAADDGLLLMGTMDSWLIWNLTEGKVHSTDYTNASRTMLFNIHTLDWDQELLDLFTIPRSMMPKTMPCDSVFGSTTLGGLFDAPIEIAGVLGDSHGALAGQMCFEEGLGKVTYGTGSSVMVNIGETVSKAPAGLVTSVGYAALNKVYYAFEGNIHCTGATISWLKNNLEIISSPEEIEDIAKSVTDNGGVYFVPAFVGLAAPWWHSDVKAAIFGLTLGTQKAHLLRSALESIAYQVDDLVGAMTHQAGIVLKELRVDGGPTKNNFLMQFQADILQTPINRSEIEEASSLGAVVMNGFARKLWKSFDEVASLRNANKPITPVMTAEKAEDFRSQWHLAVNQLIKK